MGNEIGQQSEWNHESELPWNFEQNSYQAGIMRWVSDLNKFYKATSALYQFDYQYEGFEWIDFSDKNQGVLSCLRKNGAKKEYILAVGNFTPEIRKGYGVGVPFSGKWIEVLNSDHSQYNGSGCINKKEMLSKNSPMHGRSYSLSLDLPPLGITVLKKV